MAFLRATTSKLPAVAAICFIGCAAPIKTEYYSRTPAAEAWRLEKPCDELRVGVGVDAPTLASCFVAYGSPSPRHAETAQYIGAPGADARLREQAGEFVRYASSGGHFKAVALVSPGTVLDLDCQIELSISFEHVGDSHVHYCLARLIANIYDAGHNELLHRAVKFHEAMYTPMCTPIKNDIKMSHDYDRVESKLRDFLFGELIADIKSACGARPAASLAATGL